MWHEISVGNEFRESPIFHVRREDWNFSEKIFGMSLSSVPGNISGKACKGWTFIIMFFLTIKTNIHVLWRVVKSHLSCQLVVFLWPDQFGSPLIPLREFNNIDLRNLLDMEPLFWQKKRSSYGVNNKTVIKYELICVQDVFNHPRKITNLKCLFWCSQIQVVHFVNYSKVPKVTFPRE